jgi:hypothetical protein
MIAVIALSDGMAWREVLISNHRSPGEISFSRGLADESADTEALEQRQCRRRSEQLAKGNVLLLRYCQCNIKEPHEANRNCFLSLPLVFLSNLCIAPGSLVRGYRKIQVPVSVNLDIC